MKKSLLLCILVLSSLRGFGIDVYEEFANAVRSGDSRQVASYFGNTIDLTLIKQEEIYSKAQAELILKDFFSKNSPKSFSFIHKGSSNEGTIYGIGTLKTANSKTFRVSFYMKSTKGKHVLLELRIEHE